MTTRPASSCLRAAMVGFLLCVPSARAVETPFTPYKDGYVTLSTWVGNSRTLQVRADESRAWVSHALPEGPERLPAGARLSVYVKDIARDGRLKVYLTTTLRSLEQQTRNLEYAAKDSVGSAELRAQDHLESMVDIPLSEAFLNSLRDGSYTGLILEGADGLDAEVGALEGSHGAILYLDHSAASARVDSVLVKSVAQELVRTHRVEIQGRDGTNGLSGRDGVDGKDGKPGDSTVVFRLLQDRNFRALYAFDRFRNSSAGRTTPDSSGNGNDLTLSANGTNLRANAPGDSVVEFLGNGYAVASNSLSLNPYREIMISAKVKLSTDAPPDTQIILSKANQYELAVIGSRLMCRFKTVFGSWSWISGAVVPKGTWVTVGAGYDGKAVRTFVGGLQTAYVNFPNGPLEMDTTSLYIGAANTSGDWGFKGTLDLVWITSYTVNVQDSLAVIPGRVTMAQVVADSVAGLKVLLDAKAHLTHTHAISQVASLQPALDAKANASHGHSMPEISGLNSVLNAKVDALNPVFAGRLNLNTPASSSEISSMSIDVGSFGTPSNANASYYFRCRDLGNSANPAFIIKGNGFVGVGRDPGYQLDVSGIIRGNNVSPSDIRYKKKVKTIDSAYSKISKLQGVTYEWDLDAYPNLGFESGLQLGFVAQDVEKVVPELVKVDTEGYRAINYEKVVPLLVEALKEQQKQFDRLKRNFCTDLPNSEMCRN